MIVTWLSKYLSILNLLARSLAGMTVATVGSHTFLVLGQRKVCKRKTVSQARAAITFQSGLQSNLSAESYYRRFDGRATPYTESY
jgi:hypothetical protein